MLAVSISPSPHTCCCSVRWFEILITAPWPPHINQTQGFLASEVLSDFPSGLQAPPASLYTRLHPGRGWIKACTSTLIGVQWLVLPSQSCISCTPISPQWDSSMSGNSQTYGIILHSRTSHRIHPRQPWPSAQLHHRHLHAVSSPFFLLMLPSPCQSDPRKCPGNARTWWAGEDVRHSNTLVVGYWCVIEPQWWETKEQLLLHTHTDAHTHTIVWNSEYHYSQRFHVCMTVFQLAWNSRSPHDSLCSDSWGWSAYVCVWARACVCVWTQYFCGKLHCLNLFVCSPDVTLLEESW